MVYAEYLKEYMLPAVYAAFVTVMNYLEAVKEEEPENQEAREALIVVRRYLRDDAVLSPAKTSED